MNTIHKAKVCRNLTKSLLSEAISGKRKRPITEDSTPLKVEMSIEGRKQEKFDR